MKIFHFNIRMSARTGMKFQAYLSLLPPKVLYDNTREIEKDGYKKIRYYVYGI